MNSIRNYNYYKDIVETKFIAESIVYLKNLENVRATPGICCIIREWIPFLFSCTLPRSSVLQFSGFRPRLLNYKPSSNL